MPLFTVYVNICLFLPLANVFELHILLYAPSQYLKLKEFIYIYFYFIKIKKKKKTYINSLINLNKHVL